MTWAPALVAWLVLSARPLAAELPVPESPRDIRAAEQALVDAVQARDRERLEAILAPGYVLVGTPDIDRETWIRNALALCWGDRSDIDNFRTREREGVVIASFRLTFYTDPASCRPALLRSLVTDVWIRDAGGWRLHVRHSGPPPSGANDLAAQFGVVPLPDPSWELKGEVSLIATAGNTSTRTLGAGSNVRHRSARASTNLSLAFVTSETDAVTNARSLATDARHARRVGARTEVFGRGSYVRDRFAGIGHRTGVDAGVAVTASRPRHAITAEASVGFTAEQRLDDTNLRFASGNGTVKYAWTPRTGTELTQDVRVHADLGAPDNWRGTSMTALSITLTQVLAIKASHGLEYRHRPVAGFGRTDMRTAMALVVAWQRRPGYP
jgi:putative salt-induced outer membrane protein YdiY